MKISARNAMKGIVKLVVPGVVTTEVVIEVAPGLEVVSIITKSSAETLGLAVGDAAYAVVKASDVMVAVE
jgi:molybdopterin-binding protein